MTAIIIAIGLGLVAANFIYQAFGPQEYGAAFERSFFQTVALIAVWAALTARQALT